MAARYWVGGSANWDATAGTKWAATSGGAGGASVPTTGDDVFFDGNSGAAVVTIPTSTTVSAFNIDCTGFTGNWTFAASTSSIDCRGALLLATGMSITNTGVGLISMAATTTNGGAGFNVDPKGKTLPRLRFVGAGGKWNLTGGFGITSGGDWLVTAGDFQITGTGLTVNSTTFNFTGTNTRTVKLGDAIINLNFNGEAWTSTVTTGLTFDAQTSDVRLTGLNASVRSNSLTFNKLTFSGGGSMVLNSGGNANTYDTLTVTGTANQTDIFNIGGNNGSQINTALIINGNSAVNRIQIQSAASSLGTQRTIVLGASATFKSNSNNFDLMDISMSGGAANERDFSAFTAVGDRQGNSGITFPAAANQTFSSGAGSWSNPAKWTSRVPLPQDDVFFNSSSGNVTMDVFCLGHSIDWTGYTGTLTRSSSNTPLTVFGNHTLASGMNMGTAPNTQIFEYRGRGSHTITSNGQVHFSATSNQSLYILAPGGTYTLADAINVQTTSTAFAAILTCNAGTLDLNGLTHVCGQFASATTSYARTINITNATIRSYTTGNQTAVNLNATNLTIVGASSAVFNFISTATVTRNISLNGATFCKVSYTNAGSTGALGFTTSGNLEALDFSDATNARSILITANQTVGIVNAAASNIAGSAGKLVTIASLTSGTPAAIDVMAGGVLSMDYLSVQDIRSQGPYNMFAGTHSTDVSGNLDVIFSAPLATPLVKQRNYVQNTTAGTSHSVPFLKPTVAGNLIVVVETIQLNPGTFTPPSGYTQAKIENSTTDVYEKIYYKIADGSETSVSASWVTARSNDIAVYEIYNWSGTPTLDVTDSKVELAGVTSTSTGTGASNTASPAFAIAGFGTAGTAGASVYGTPPTNGWQEDYDVTAGRQRVAAKPLTANASQTSTVTWTTSRIAASAMAIFKDVVVANNWTKSLSDAATASDSFARTVAYLRTIGDTAVASDSMSKSSGYHATITDSTASSDATAKAVTKLRTDIATVTDAISKAPRKIFADIATVADSFSKAMGYHAAISDSIASSDQIAKNFIKRFADSVTVNDLWGRRWLKTLADVITVSDIATPVLQGFVAIAKAIHRTAVFASKPVVSAILRTSRVTARFGRYILKVKIRREDQ